MNISAIAVALVDNGGRRIGFDRREFLYTNHVPERRSNPERRKLPDRRRLSDRRHHAENSSAPNGLLSLKHMMGFGFRGKKQERRSNHERRSAFAGVFAPA